MSKTYYIKSIQMRNETLKCTRNTFADINADIPCVRTFSCSTIQKFFY